MPAPGPYKANQRFFKEFAVGPELRGIVRSIAEDAKVIARETSEDFRQTGEYSDSFEVDTEVIEFGRRYPTERVTGVLKNTAPHAAAVEWGYKGRAEAETESAHRVLGRTLERLSGIEHAQ